MITPSHYVFVIHLLSGTGDAQLREKWVLLCALHSTCSVGLGPIYSLWPNFFFSLCGTWIGHYFIARQASIVTIHGLLFLAIIWRWTTIHFHWSIEYGITRMKTSKNKYTNGRHREWVISIFAYIKRFMYSIPRGNHKNVPSKDN